MLWQPRDYTYLSKCTRPRHLELQTKPLRPSAISLVFLAASLAVFTPQCFAALGNDISSIQLDQIRLNASLRSTQKSGYVLHELRTQSGIIVREFSSPSGKIFAVAWEGPALPDLRQILGSHFEDFRQAAEARNRRDVQAPLFIQQNGLTVELGGHMRSYRGKAYLNDEMPAAVHKEELR